MGSRARLILVGLAVCIASVPAHAAVISGAPSPDLLGPIVDPLVEGTTDELDSALGTDTSPVEDLLESTTGTVDDVATDVVSTATDPVPTKPIDPVPTTTTIGPSITTTTRVLPTTTTSLVVSTMPLTKEPRPEPLPEPVPAHPATPPSAVTLRESALDPAPTLLTTPVDALVSPDRAESGSWADIFDFVGDVNVGSFLAAPWLALEVLLRALASAGEGLLAPGVMLVGLAMLMARDRRISGTKTP